MRIGESPSGARPQAFGASRRSEIFLRGRVRYVLAMNIGCPPTAVSIFRLGGGLFGCGMPSYSYGVMELKGLRPGGARDIVRDGLR